MPSPWLLAAVSAVHLLADTTGTFDLSNRTEVRLRSTQNVTPNPSLDLFDTAALHLTLASQETTFRVGYSASVLDADAELLIPPLFLQAADVGVAWRNRQVSLGASEAAAYGVENSAVFGPLTGTTTTPISGGPSGTPAGMGVTQAPPSGAVPTGPMTTTPQSNVQLLGAPRNLTFVSSRSELTASDRLWREGTLSLLVAYLVQGGTDPGSQTVLPLVRGPSAEAHYAQSLSARDGVEVLLSGRLSETAPSVCSPILPPALLIAPGQPCEPVDYIEQASALWKHQLDSNTSMSLGAGLAAVQVRLQDVQPELDTNFLPVASASLHHTEIVAKRATNEYSLDATLGPFLDFLSGSVDERLQVTASSRFPSRTVVYTAALGATHTVFTAFVEPMTSIQANGDVEFLLSPAVSVGGGALAAWQTIETLGSFALGIIYGSLTLRVPTVTF